VKCLNNKKCEHFKWDCDWQYCELQEEEIDPSKCIECDPEVLKKALKRERRFRIKKIRPFFRLYDLWIGIYVDTKNRAIYIIPIPMIGIKISY
jgi:hypothetical protein